MNNGLNSSITAVEVAVECRKLLATYSERRSELDTSFLVQNLQYPNAVLPRVVSAIPIDVHVVV